VWSDIANRSISLAAYQRTAPVLGMTANMTPIFSLLSPLPTWETLGKFRSEDAEAFGGKAVSCKPSM
jgi:hypothetical protein